MQREAMETFDINREPETHPSSLPRHAFRSLLACWRGRLVEAGVRFVTVYYVATISAVGTTHTNHDARTAICADGTVAAAALISDLKTRGLLDDHLVIWGGEFGRTPYARIARKTRFPAGTIITRVLVLLAGGGVREGWSMGL